MHAPEDVCQRCGLPVGRAEGHGPLWTPNVQGVEVCGCPPEAELQRARADAIEHDLAELEAELDEIQHHRHP